MNFRKVQAVGIASALALTLAACGGSEDFDTPSGSEPTSAKDPSESVSPHDPEGSDTDSESDTDTDADADSDADSNDSKTSSDIDLASEETPVTAADALEISADEVAGGDAEIVHAIELEYSSSSDRWEWSVKTLVDGTDHKVKIDADSGEVIKHEEDSTNDEEKAIDLDDPMPFFEAKDIALDARDGRITSWKYEWDDGRYEYEFDIEADGSTEEVNVNAETGEAHLD